MRLRRPRQRQHVVARQRRERQIGQRARIDPDDFVDLRSRRDGAFDVDRIDRGAHREARLVRRRAIEHAERRARSR